MTREIILPLGIFGLATLRRLCRESNESHGAYYGGEFIAKFSPDQECAIHRIPGFIHSGTSWAKFEPSAIGKVEHVHFVPMEHAGE